MLSKLHELFIYPIVLRPLLSLFDTVASTPFPTRQQRLTKEPRGFRPEVRLVQYSVYTAADQLPLGSPQAGRLRWHRPAFCWKVLLKSHSWLMLTPQGSQRKRSSGIVCKAEANLPGALVGLFLGRPELFLLPSWKSLCSHSSEPHLDSPCPNKGEIVATLQGEQEVRQLTLLPLSAPPTPSQYPQGASAILSPGRKNVKTRVDKNQ